MTRGRPPEGPDLAQRIEGPKEAKQRLQVILETIAGGKTIAHACEELGIGPTRFHELRTEALSAACQALVARSPGRPPDTPEVPPELEKRLHELEVKNKELTVELKAAETRELIALTMPGLLKGNAPRRGKRGRHRRS